ncbi:unnamed protein product [Withania somnifera]
MEVWALEGFGVAHILQEMLTYKSDHIRARREVLGTTIVGGTIPNPKDAPRIFSIEKLSSQSIQLGCPRHDMSLGKSNMKLGFGV